MRIRVAVLAAVSLVACGGSVAPIAPADADAAAPPAMTTPSTDACESYRAYADRCEPSSACADARVASCKDYIGMMSNAYRRVLATCSAIESCNDPDAATATCISSAIAAAPLTDTQQAVASAYCAQCGGGTCAPDFFAYPPGASSGEGLLVAYAGDALAKQMGEARVGQCGRAFATCALNVLADAFPPTPEACR